MPMCVNKDVGVNYCGGGKLSDTMLESTFANTHILNSVSHISIMYRVKSSLYVAFDRAYDTNTTLLPSMVFFHPSPQSRKLITNFPRTMIIVLVIFNKMA